MARERLLAMTDVSPEDWATFKQACKLLDVEESDEWDHVWDVRDRDDPATDEIYLWGRDGWKHGFWHARLVLEDDKAWLERSDDERAMRLVQALDVVAAVATEAFEEVSDDSIGVEGAD